MKWLREIFSDVRTKPYIYLALLLSVSCGVYSLFYILGVKPEDHVCRPTKVFVGFVAGCEAYSVTDAACLEVTALFCELARKKQALEELMRGEL